MFTKTLFAVCNQFARPVAEQSSLPIHEPQKYLLLCLACYTCIATSYETLCTALYFISCLPTHDTWLSPAAFGCRRVLCTLAGKLSAVRMQRLLRQLPTLCKLEVLQFLQPHSCHHVVLSWLLSSSIVSLDCCFNKNVPGASATCSSAE